MAESQGLLIRRNTVSSPVSSSSLLILLSQNQILARGRNQRDDAGHPAFNHDQDHAQEHGAWQTQSGLTSNEKCQTQDAKFPVF